MPAFPIPLRRLAARGGLALACLLAGATVLAQSPPRAGNDAYRQAVEARREQRYEDALAMLQPLAEKGHAPSQTLLGMMYRIGQGTPKDFAKAREWLQKAADQNHPVGIQQLALTWLLGEGTDKDPVKARELAEKAQSLGVPEASLLLGDLYAQGNGVTRDLARARTLYEQAAEKGNENAKKRLAALDNPAPATAPQAASAPPDVDRAAILAAAPVRARLDISERKLDETLDALDATLREGYGGTESPKGKAREEARAQAREARAKLAQELAQATRGVHRYGSFNDSGKGKLTLQFMGMTAVGRWCLIDFRLMNKLGFDLGRNTLHGQIFARNTNARMFPPDDPTQEVGPLVNFDGLKNGAFVDGTVLLSWRDACQYDEGKGLPFAMIGKLQMGDADRAIREGLTSDAQFALSGGPDSFNFRMSVAGQYLERARMGDPKYREAKAKYQACYERCTGPDTTLACMQRFNNNGTICAQQASACLQGCGPN